MNETSIQKLPKKTEQRLRQINDDDDFVRIIGAALMLLSEYNEYGLPHHHNISKKQVREELGKLGKTIDSLRHPFWTDLKPILQFEQLKRAAEYRLEVYAAPENRRRKQSFRPFLLGVLHTSFRDLLKLNITTYDSGLFVIVAQFICEELGVQGIGYTDLAREALIYKPIPINWDKSRLT
jgi:hypothetical protein